MIERADQVFDLIRLEIGSVELKGAVLQYEAKEVLLGAPLS